MVEEMMLELVELAFGVELAKEEIEVLSDGNELHEG